MAVDKISREEMVNAFDTAMSSISSELVNLKTILHNNGYTDKSVPYQFVNSLWKKVKVSGEDIILKITPKSINDSNQPIKSESYVTEMDTDNDTIVITADLTNTDKEAAAKMADKNGKELKIVSEIRNLRDKKKIFFELLK